MFFLGRSLRFGRASAGNCFSWLRTIPIDGKLISFTLRVLIGDRQGVAVLAIAQQDPFAIDLELRGRNDVPVLVAAGVPATPAAKP
jgi:hypothetical protein